MITLRIFKLLDRIAVMIDELRFASNLCFIQIVVGYSQVEIVFRRIQHFLCPSSIKI